MTDSDFATVASTIPVTFVPGLQELFKQQQNGGLSVVAVTGNGNFSDFQSSMEKWARQEATERLKNLYNKMKAQGTCPSLDSLKDGTLNGTWKLGISASVSSNGAKVNITLAH